MLSIDEIKRFIDEDAASERKKQAKKGQRYYDGMHDIQEYRIFFYNADGNLTEDTTRSNIKISHPFFTELVDQAVQYILSGEDGFIRSDIPELQDKLDKYFNNDEDFIAELSEVLTGSQVKGFDFLYAYKNKEDRLAFQCADGMGVIEVRAKDTNAKAEHIIYWYVDRIDKGFKKVKCIQVWDEKEVSFFVQVDNGMIEKDASEVINPKPHTLYKSGKDGKVYQDRFGFIPFFRLDNNKKQISALKPIKPIIDDYDLMNCGLSNNLVDFDTPIYVVKGFENDVMDELFQNVKTKKMVGMESTDTGAGMEVHTIDVPYEARVKKLEVDEKNIYRFGMGLNTSGLKDTTATTNIAIKAAYSLLDLKCAKIIIQLKRFLRKLIKVVLDEVNTIHKTDYQQKDVYFRFKPEIMSNELENAQIALTKAQKRQTEINTLLGLAACLDDETFMQLVCEQLDIDYEEIKGKLPEDEENQTKRTLLDLESVIPQEEGGGTGEQGADGSTKGAVKG